MRSKYLALGAVAALLVWACSSETTETEECAPTLGEEISLEDVQPGDTVYVDTLYVTVELWSGVREEDREFLRSLGAKIMYEYVTLPRVYFYMPGEALPALVDYPRVKRIWISERGGSFPGC